MTKSEMLALLDGLDDDAQIYFEELTTDIDGYECRVPLDFYLSEEKITGDKFKNEITILLGL